ncbi:MAG TPA: hypothetical protein DD621_00390, partial [Clostridiales bacterium]|nr:hypothetical protein [Clostridiales bacterium]
MDQTARRPKLRTSKSITNGNAILHIGLKIYLDNEEIISQSNEYKRFADLNFNISSPYLYKRNSDIVYDDQSYKSGNYVANSSYLDNVGFINDNGIYVKDGQILTITGNTNADKLTGVSHFDVIKVCIDENNSNTNFASILDFDTTNKYGYISSEYKYTSNSNSDTPSELQIKMRDYDFKGWTDAQPVVMKVYLRTRLKGAGTFNNPYQISNFNHFIYGIKNQNVDGNGKYYYKQLCDINLKPYHDSNNKVGLADNSRYEMGNETLYNAIMDDFKGIYNGYGFKISVDSGYIKRLLFGTENSGNVHNLYVEVSGTYTSSNLSNFGFITGKNTGTIKDVAVILKSNVTFPSYGSATSNGLIAGENSGNGKILDSGVWNAYSYRLTSSRAGNIGGIVGYNNNDNYYGKISGCFAKVNISASSATYAGGIVGYAVNDNYRIDNCNFEGNVSGNTSTTYVGPISPDPANRYYYKNCVWTSGNITGKYIDPSVNMEKYPTHIITSANKYSYKYLSETLTSPFNFNTYWSYEPNNSTTAPSRSTTSVMPRLISRQKLIGRYRKTYSSIADAYKSFGYNTSTSSLSEADKTIYDCDETNVYKVTNVTEFMTMLYLIDNVTLNSTRFIITSDISLYNSDADSYTYISPDVIPDELPSNVAIDGGYNNTYGHSIVSGIRLDYGITHTDTNLSVYSSSKISLFGYVYGSINNLIIEDSSVNYDTINTQSVFKGSKEGDRFVSLFGTVNTSKPIINDCEINCDINYFKDYYNESGMNVYTGTSQYTYIGSVFSHDNTTNSSIVNGLKVKGNINYYQYRSNTSLAGRVRIGGLIGSLEYNSKFKQVASLVNINYYSTNNSLVSNRYIGGLIGYANYTGTAHLEDCYYGDGKVGITKFTSGTAREYYGNINVTSTTNSSLITRCYAVANITSNQETAQQVYNRSVSEKWDTKLTWYVYNNTTYPTLWIHNPNGRKVDITSALGMDEQVSGWYKSKPILDKSTSATGSIAISGESKVTDSFYIDIVDGNFTEGSVSGHINAKDNQVYFTIKNNDDDETPNRDMYVLVLDVKAYSMYASGNWLTSPDKNILYTEVPRQYETADDFAQKQDVGFNFSKFKTQNTEDLTYSAVRWKNISIDINAGYKLYSFQFDAPNLSKLASDSGNGDATSDTLSGGDKINYSISVIQGDQRKGPYGDDNLYSSNIRTVGETYLNTLSSKIFIKCGDIIEVQFDMNNSKIPFVQGKKWAENTRLSTNYGLRLSNGKLTSANLLNTNINNRTINNDDGILGDIYTGESGTDFTTSFTIAPDNSTAYNDYFYNGKSVQHITPIYQRMTKVVTQLAITNAQDKTTVFPYTSTILNSKYDLLGCDAEGTPLDSSYVKEVNSSNGTAQDISTSTPKFKSYYVDGNVITNGTKSGILMSAPGNTVLCEYKNNQYTNAYQYNFKLNKYEFVRTSGASNQRVTSGSEKMSDINNELSKEVPHSQTSYLTDTYTFMYNYTSYKLDLTVLESGTGMNKDNPNQDLKYVSYKVMNQYAAFEGTSYTTGEIGLSSVEYNTESAKVNKLVSPKSNFKKLQGRVRITALLSVPADGIIRYKYYDKKFTSGGLKDTENITDANGNIYNTIKIISVNDASTGYSREIGITIDFYILQDTAITISFEPCSDYINLYGSDTYNDSNNNKENPYAIKNIADFVKFLRTEQNNLTNKENHYRIDNDINFNELNFKYDVNVGIETKTELNNAYFGFNYETIHGDGNPFKGSINGLGHGILNLYSEYDDRTHFGFIGVIDTNGVVERIVLENPKFISHKKKDTLKVYIGGIAGMNHGTIRQCGVTYGFDTNNDVSDCLFSALPTTSNMSDKMGNIIGGIAAFTEGSNAKIINSFFDGTLEGDYVVGGITGILSNCASISGCYSHGQATGNIVAGIAGQIEENERINISEPTQKLCKIEYCYSYMGLTGLGNNPVRSGIAKVNYISVNNENKSVVVTFSYFITDYDITNPPSINSITSDDGTIKTLPETNSIDKLRSYNQVKNTDGGYVNTTYVARMVDSQASEYWFDSDLYGDWDIDGTADISLLKQHNYGTPYITSIGNSVFYTISAWTNGTQLVYDEEHQYDKGSYNLLADKAGWDFRTYKREGNNEIYEEPVNERVECEVWSNGKVHTRKLRLNTKFYVPYNSEVTIAMENKKDVVGNSSEFYTLKGVYARSINDQISDDNPQLLDDNKYTKYYNTDYLDGTDYKKLKLTKDTAFQFYFYNAQPTITLYPSEKYYDDNTFANTKNKALIIDNYDFKSIKDQTNHYDDSNLSIYNSSDAIYTQNRITLDMKNNAIVDGNNVSLYQLSEIRFRYPYKQTGEYDIPTDEDWINGTLGVDYAAIKFDRDGKITIVGYTVNNEKYYINENVAIYNGKVENKTGEKLTTYNIVCRHTELFNNNSEDSTSVVKKNEYFKYSIEKSSTGKISVSFFGVETRNIEMSVFCSYKLDVKITAPNGAKLEGSSIKLNAITDITNPVIAPTNYVGNNGDSNILATTGINNTLELLINPGTVVKNELSGSWEFRHYEYDFKYETSNTTNTAGNELIAAEILKSVDVKTYGDSGTSINIVSALYDNSVDN